MWRRSLLPLLLLVSLSSRAAPPDPVTRELLAKAWPDNSAASLSDLGRGVGVVFSPDLSVPGNCRFYRSIGFDCYEDTDWSRVLDGIRTRFLEDPTSSIRTLILETHGTNGNGLKLQRSYDPAAERSYISVGGLQERLALYGVKFVIISACNSGRLLRPSIYRQLDRWNGDKLFLPATCGIIDASSRFDPAKDNVVIISPRSSHIETTVGGSVSELSRNARSLLERAARRRKLGKLSQFAVSDVFCQIMLGDRKLELTTNSYVDELSAKELPDEASDALFDRFVALLNTRARLEVRKEQRRPQRVAKSPQTRKIPPAH